jgi:hypothetical protein
VTSIVDGYGEPSLASRMATGFGLLKVVVVPVVMFRVAYLRDVN